LAIVVCALATSGLRLLALRFAWTLPSIGDTDRS